MSNNQISKIIKAIEKVLVGYGEMEKIVPERNARNKSCYVWFTEAYKEIERIKLEIGSSVKPHPYSKKELQSYIQDYLERIDESGAVEEFQLKRIQVNVLNIERTFVGEAPTNLKVRGF